MTAVFLLFIGIFVADFRKFDMKFTKGDTIISPVKLGYFQRKYAVKYAEEGGPRFDDMVERTSAAVKEALETGDR